MVLLILCIFDITVILVDVFIAFTDIFTEECFFCVKFAKSCPGCTGQVFVICQQFISLFLDLFQPFFRFHFFCHRRSQVLICLCDPLGNIAHLFLIRITDRTLLHGINVAVQRTFEHIQLSGLLIKCKIQTWYRFVQLVNISQDLRLTAANGISAFCQGIYFICHDLQGFTLGYCTVLCLLKGFPAFITRFFQILIFLCKLFYFSGLFFTFRLDIIGRCP